VRGLSLGLFGDQDAATDDVALAEIADLGATWVALVVTWSQSDVHAVELARGPRSAPDRRLRAAIRRARARGLAVMVFPIIELDRVRRGEWRGTLAPDDVDTWWHAYERFILHYAELAEAEGAAALVVGSELGSTETWRDRWYHLLSKVESRYRGERVYSANWDHYRQVSFAERLDHLGISAYPTLSDDADASTAELTRAWRKTRRELDTFATAAGVSLWLTEVGYPSRDGAASQPWNYQRRAAVDLDEQRRCYQAMVTAWDGDATLAGLFVWNWSGKGGERDGDYTPRGKPAEAVLRAWFGGR
jgi:hypothetical protein